MIIKILLFIWQWTWGLIQNLFGLIIVICLRKKSLDTFHGAVIVEYQEAQFIKPWGTFTLGMFIFYELVANERDPHLLAHEYGHTIQSLIYGPLYLPIVGVFSLSWARKYWKNKKAYNQENIFYADRYPEKQANYWGKKILGIEGISE